MNPTEKHTITNKGLFLPTWIVTLVFTPIFAVGLGSLGWVIKTLIKQDQTLIKIEGKVDKTNDLMNQSLESHEKRINRLENRVFDQN